MDSISPEFGAASRSEDNDSIISEEETSSVSNFVANSLFNMVLLDQKLIWPIDSSGSLQF